MTATLLRARLSCAVVQACLSQTGFSTIEEVDFALRQSDDVEEILQALTALCDSAPEDEADETTKNEPGTDTSKRRNVIPELKSFYGKDGPTHAVLPAAAVIVPEVVSRLFETFRTAFGAESGQPSTVGWSLAIDERVGDAAGILLRLSSTGGFKRVPKVAEHIGDVREALGVPIHIEIAGTPLAHAGSPWAHKEHDVVSCGMSIGISEGSASRAATITLPVRRDADRYIITAGHWAHPDQLQSIVRQPSRSTSHLRNVGHTEEIAYEEAFDAVNFIDAALVKLNEPLSSPGFGGGGFQLAGVSNKEIQSGDTLYLFGATTGLRRVIVEFPQMEITMLSNDGNRIIYKDVIEIYDDENEKRMPSKAGDSGAPLLLRDKKRFWIVGMVLGGGPHAAGKNRARSYAVPIQRVLSQLDVEAI